MKPWPTALLLMATLAAGGCGSATLYRATPDETRDLSPMQARKLLITAAQTDGLCEDPGSVSATYERIDITCATGSPKTRSFAYAQTPSLVAILDLPLGGLGELSSACVKASEQQEDCMFYWPGTSHDDARSVVRAWSVLARAAADYPAQEAAFEKVALGYRNEQVKPKLPEEAVRFKVQAELAVQQKRFEDAVGLYEQALGIAPWWPAGHYNRGLILGELTDYQGAIRELQKYLKLEPGAANARAVQLKIYELEGLIPGAAR